MLVNVPWDIIVSRSIMWGQPGQQQQFGLSNIQSSLSEPQCLAFHLYHDYESGTCPPIVLHEYSFSHGVCLTFGLCDYQELCSCPSQKQGGVWKLITELQACKSQEKVPYCQQPVGSGTLSCLVLVLSIQPHCTPSITGTSIRIIHGSQMLLVCSPIAFLHGASRCLL